MTEKLNYMRFPKHNTTVEITKNKKGTKYYCVDVADKYSFYFNSKRNLVEIDDFSTGSWDTFSTKSDRDWWLNLKGSMDVYKRHVLPSLEEFIKKRKMVK